MGNYYEGSISLYLKKDTPKEVLQTLLGVPKKSNAPMSYIADNFKGMEMFENDKYKPRVQITVELINKDAHISYFDLHYELDKANEARNNGYQIEAFIVDFEFYASTSSDEFYRTVAQDWFNLVKDYVDVAYAENIIKVVHGGLIKLGEVYDENGYYDLIFVINQNKEPEILDFSLQPNVSNKVSEYKMQEEQEQDIEMD